MEKNIVKVLWGDDHYEDTLEETIHYMIEHEELYKDEIVGKQVEFCEEANVYSDKDYVEIQNIIYGEEDVYIGDYFEKKREEIMKLIESVKYYNPFQKYVITEEDYEEAIKSLLNLDNYEAKLPVEYIVTTELRTPWWLKLLRFFRIKNKREEFTILLKYDGYNINDIILSTSKGVDLKVLNKTTLRY